MSVLKAFLQVAVATAVAGSLAAGDRRVVDTATTSSSSTVSAKVLDELPTPTRDLRLLIQQARPIDRLTVEGGKRYVSGSRARIIPDGWSCQPSGGSWSCGGPAIPAGTPGRFAWQSPTGVEVPSSFGVELFSGGTRLYKDTISAELQHGFAVKTDLKDVLEIPAGVGSGSLFMASPATDAYRGGRWGFQVDGKPVAPVDPSSLHLKWDLGGPIPRDRLFFRLPEGTGSGSPIGFTYDDPWGDRTVDAPVPVWFFGQPAAAPCSPAGLHTCQERVSVGTSICVCGCFPDPLAADLTLDGKPIPFPSAFSSSVIRIPLPDVTPGTHAISWGSLGQTVEFEAVSLAGAIAQDKLMLGQSTMLDFTLAGTRVQLPLQIALTAGGVSIQGGNTQVAYFDGSDRNQIQRTVLAIAVGDFAIEYTLDLPPCPCGGWQGAVLEDPSLMTHPMTAAGHADTTLIGSGIRFPMTFHSNSIIARTPRPPFSAGGRVDIGFAQLGLHASTPGSGELLFEQRADQASTATLENIRLGSDGGVAACDADIRFSTQFSVPAREDFPLKVGASYTFDVNDFALDGSSPGLGDVRFRQTPGAASSIRFTDLAKDAAGATLFGNADFQLRGQLTIGGGALAAP